MEPVGVDVGRKRDLHFTRVRVAAAEHADNIAAGRLARPYEPVHHQQVLGRSVPGRRVIGRPERLAGAGVQRGQRIFAAFVPASGLFARGLTAGEEDDAVVKDEDRHIIGLDLLASRHGFGPPKLVARAAVQTDDAGAVVKDDSPDVGRQRAGEHAAFDAPENLAGFGLGGHDLSGRFVPELRTVALAETFAAVVVGFLYGVVHQRKEHAVGEDDLLGGLGFLVGADRVARGGVERQQRPVEVQRDVHPVGRGD